MSDAPEHVEAGRIDLLDLGIYTHLRLKANGAGVTETSATSLHALCPQVSSRTLQRRLGHIEKLGWIKTSKTPGRNGKYVVLICRALVGDFVDDAQELNADAATDPHDHPCEHVGEPNSDVTGSQPAANFAENIDSEGQASPTQPSTPSNPLEELGIGHLPDRHRDFVELVVVNPRADGESLGEWAKRMRRLSDEKNVFLPRAVHARVRQAAA